MSNITLKDFLIKFTAVPESFINEYYQFYEICKTEQFGINIEKLVTYLGITNQDKFEERIRESYTLNTDYVIIRDMKKLRESRTHIICYPLKHLKKYA